MRWFVALLVVLLALGPVAGAGQPTGDRAPAHETSFGPVEQFGPVAQAGAPNGADANRSADDGTTMRISLQKDGDARWDVTARFALRNENETAAFRQLASEYENGETDAGFTRHTFERIAERSTVDREMTIRDAERSASLLENGTVGTLTLTFTWTNFTQVDGKRVVLGDVFKTESGTWLPKLENGQTLILDGPDDYYVYNSNTSVKNGTRIRFEGPRTLDSSTLWVTYEPTNPDSPGTTTGEGWTNLSGVPGIVLLIVVGIGGASAYAWAQRGNDPVVTETADAPPSAPPEESTDEGRETAHADAADANDDTDDTDDTDVKLLSDEERVLRLLRNNDGRMKQADIVKETNWSNAKVSQLLSKMDDSDDVDKLRIGRENLITLPDEDVTDMN